MIYKRYNAHMTGTFIINTEKNRFEYAVGGSTAYADFRREGIKLYIDYVFAPDELRGTGAAGDLMQNIVNYAKQENLRVVPKCPYAAGWIKKNRKGPDLRP